jgi:hypothetical protein
MVSIKLLRRLPHFVPLSLLKSLSSSSSPSTNLEYLTSDQLGALQTMPLLNRGRLSVQSVPSKAWEAVLALGEKGGWDDVGTGGAGVKKGRKNARGKKSDEDEGHDDGKEEAKAKANGREDEGKAKKGRKRKAKDEGDKGEAIDNHAERDSPPSQNSKQDETKTNSIGTESRRSKRTRTRS